MKVHYMFAPTVPVHVEMYESRDHFSVRTSGLPNIGIQGVCFGHVVAAMSPASEPFNWGNVLWHELGHVFAIQLSKNHVPRWFTEGLSEYETMIRRPGVAARARSGALLGAEEEPAARRGRHEPRLHARRGRPGRDRRLLRGEPDGRVHRGAVRLRRGSRARSQLWGAGQAHAGRPARGVRRHAAGVRRALPRVGSWRASRGTRGSTCSTCKPKPLDEAKAAAAASPKSADGARRRTRRAAARAQGRRRGAGAGGGAEPSTRTTRTRTSSSAKLAGQDEGPRRRRRSTFARSRRPAATGTRSRWRSASWRRRKHDKAGERAALEAAHRFDPTQAEADARPLRPGDDGEARRGRAGGAARGGAARPARPARRGSCSLGKLVEAKKWDEAKRVGEAALYVDVESADDPRRLRPRPRGDGRPRDGCVRARERAALRLQAAREGRGARAPGAREARAGRHAAARSHRDEALRLDPANADARALKL